MVAVLLILSIQDPRSTEEMERLLQEFQLAIESERAWVSTDATSRSSDVVSRLDTPGSRDALRRAVSDPDLAPEARLLVIEALLRLGEVRDVGRMIEALAQIRSSGKAEPSRVTAAEERVRRTGRPSPPTVVGDGRRPVAPVPADRDSLFSEMNLVLGGAALTLTALLWLLRKGSS